MDIGKLLNIKGDLKKKKIIICFSIAAVAFLTVLIGIYYGSKENIAFGKSHKYIDFLYENGGEKYKLSKFTDIREAYESKLNIQEVNYTWQEELKYKNKPKKLIIHHTSDNGLTPERINEIHVENGWAGIGYHFYIRSDGTIYRGRPEEAVGAHAKKNNNDSIGIALEGNFEEASPTEAQMEALVKLSADMIIKYNLSEVLGHRDVYETLCPGENLSIEDLKEKITKELIEINS